MRDTKESKIVHNYLEENFSGCRFVNLSDGTGGALLSALGGASLITDYAEPVIVDLVDILD